MTDPYLHQVGQAAFAYVQPPGGWWVSNAGAVAGIDGPVLIDTAATEARTNQFLDAVAQVLPSRPTAAVLTHAHGDHAGGLSLLDDIPVYAAAGCAVELGTTGLNHWPTLFPDVRWGDIATVTPNRVVGERPQVILEAAPELLANAMAGPAHSAGDLIAWLPTDGVLFAGDLAWSGVVPLCVLGSFRGWRDALDACLQLNPSVVIPGHGTPSDQRLLEVVRDYTDEVLALAQRAQAEGWSAERAASERFLSVEGWIEPERHVVNMHHALAELRGEQLNVPAAMGALVRAYGGRIPTAA